MMQPVPLQLSVRNVRKFFAGKAGEVQVLDDLSFGIIGPSGCGKTTIFNIIAGLA
jgi:NitT/TauT family transport system ATP-binding protein